MRWRAYPKYRDSGVEFMGSIPKHWRIKQVRRLTRRHKQGFYTSNEYVETGVKLARITDIDDSGNVSFDNMPYVEINSDDEQAFRISDGDFLFARSGTVGRFGLVRNPERSVFASYLIQFKLKDIDPNYARYCFLSTYFKNALYAELHGGANQNVHAENIKERFICMGSTEEQRTITAFLDREISRIDALIAKKERQIELLQEKRAALISHAVTKGLDPNEPVKDSGVEWLGEIPAKWEVKQLKWVIVFQRGHDLPIEKREEGHIPVVSSSGISGSHLKAMAKAPGIITGRYGTIGHFYLLEEEYWPLNTTLYSIEMYENDAHFLQYMLSHLSPLFLLNAVKSAVPGVDRNDIHPILTAIPPSPDQLAIAEFLDRETAKIQTLCTKVAESIDKLKEYRTALISAAVTGKIDVRGEVANAGNDA